ncbi:putative ancient ubiquitous protein 1 [Blattamonas nauphoetae]|uniref:Ancient ubiquitous protein 1 n=1 Tax=Blattamonas nauphoetae TaxID=2049346 RepID=A0ABQ9YAU0_9EUKA|nr:putative ancient ubiquitous protein 1 [Blattamonas nauphoetae]
MSTRDLIKLILWFPIGCFMGIFRIFFIFCIGIPSYAIYKKFEAETLFWKTIGQICGLRARVTNPEAVVPHDEAPVLVCNHVTDLDGVAFLPILHLPHTVHIISRYLSPVANAVTRAGWPLKLIMREIDEDKKDLTTQNVLNFFNSEESKERQLFVLAEGATTSGKVGLLRYNKFVFTLGKPIQPFAVRVNTHMPICIDCPSKNMFPNLFWYGFCPICTWEFTALPVQTICEGEKPEEFATRVQKLTADHLGIACTTYFYKDKNRMKKVNI